MPHGGQVMDPRWGSGSLARNCAPILHQDFQRETEAQGLVLPYLGISSLYLLPVFCLCPLPHGLLSLKECLNKLPPSCSSLQRLPGNT